MTISTVSLTSKSTIAGGIIFLISVAFSSLAFSQSKSLDQIRQRISDQGEILQVDFQTLFVDSFTGDYSLVQGRAWIGLDKYKVETADRLLLVEDSLSSLWDPEQRRLVLSDYVPEEDDFAPAKLFGSEDTNLLIRDVSRQDPLPGDATLAELGYTREELAQMNLEFVAPTLPRNSTPVRFTSQDPYATLLEFVMVKDNRQNPLFIRAVDQVDNVIHTQFTAVKWIKDSESSLPTSSLFTIEVPLDAEVIDLRQK